MNAGTRRPYRGVNVLLLGLEALDRGYPLNRWLTYRQADELGGQVRRREHGTTMRSISRCIATHRWPNAPFHSAICSELSAGMDRSRSAIEGRIGTRWDARRWQIERPECKCRNRRPIRQARISWGRSLGNL